MKKIFCMALSAALLAGSVPAYAAEESLFTKTPHTFTARVGTTEFTKDGAAQPLDVAIYTKNGYTMLPLRTFMQALDADAELVWEDGIQLAKVTMQDYTLSFDITGNRIWRNSSLLPSFGQMEVKDGTGRVFCSPSAISWRRAILHGTAPQGWQPSARWSRSLIPPIIWKNPH